ncbi:MULTISPECIES: hypothetical protein [unclassified Pseudomonas]|uniref:hypothetical protein n=1 Tax=unclassified Pseudomonas TaxID=196821 RepID=UPI0005B3DCFE|nr:MULTISPECIES: hypothetical protein [unclassified Pseudomonas]MDP9690628.1 hypothetical protein [Pseudomonas mohnii]PMZ91122.1 hypothetical protein C1X61_05970 [Pseudomonas sp. FW215-T2]PNA15824.1 hypothetical protein C1X62_04090 [Pseudomonas sp. FW215-R3]PNB38423.1 hypothetical protein C1X63_07795 [Pseudomonas sp. FW305-131]
MEGHNFERLKAHILQLSVASEFDRARLEWKLHAVEVSEEFDQCPCGKDIKEHCYIINSRNGNKTYVGNVCINRFLQIETGNLFAGLRKITLNPSANANEDLIEYSWEKGYLFGENEYLFLKRTMNKRKLSPDQISWKKKINNRILKGTVVRRRTVRD